MKKTLRRALAAAGALAAAVLLAVAGGAWYMLDYALRPEPDGRDTAAAWRAVCRSYAGMDVWRDSLTRRGLLRDTFVSAADGTRLHAWYARASRPGRRTALLVHGYTDNALTMMPYGRMYREEMGANILLPDLRRAGLSGGSHITMGALDHADLHRWLDVVPALFGDSARVVVHGVSMGAATAMMLSGDSLPGCVRAFVEDCGYTSVYEQFRGELRKRFGLPSFPMLDAASLLCRLRYGWDFRSASPLDAVARCRLPMLFIHGDADTYVPTAMVRPLYDAKPAPKELWLVPGAAHAASYRDRPHEYARRVARFLAPHW